MAKTTRTCNCGICRTCAPAMLARLKAEAYPPVQRNGIGAAVKGGGKK